MSEEDSKVEKPQLDEYELLAINDRIMESLESEKTILFRLYEKGYFKNGEGVVSKIDPYQKLVKIRDSHGRVAFTREINTL